jgi:hypothetical protein
MFNLSGPFLVVTHEMAWPRSGSSACSWARSMVVSLAGRNEVAGGSIHWAVVAQRRAGVVSSDSASLSSTSDMTLECLLIASAMTCFMPGQCSTMKTKSANVVASFV